MTDDSKKVFISYRREPTKFLALLLFKELRKRGYDVFWDIEGIGAGRFEHVILAEITARPFFVVLLAHGTLERVDEPNDWLRREIEYAIEHERIVVPILVDDFTFSAAKKYLNNGLLQKLPEYNAAPLRFEFFDASVDKLCNQFLVLEHGIPALASLSEDIEDEAEEIIEEAIEAPEPTQEELNAEELIRRAYRKADYGDYEGAISDYTAYIEEVPNSDIAYNNRGFAYYKMHNYEQAIKDYNKAIELNPNEAKIYSSRGVTYYQTASYEQALRDFDKAIELNPSDERAYNNRGIVYRKLADFEQAVQDFNKAIEFNPDNAIVYNNRGNVYADIKDYRQAIQDYDKAVGFNPADAVAYNNRGVVLFVLGQFQIALADFSKSFELNPQYSYAIAGLAITHHAFGNIDEAQKLWQLLFTQDKQYKNADWVGEELDWPEQLIEEARKLIEGLDLD